MLHPIVIIVVNLIGLCCILSRDRTNIDHLIIGLAVVYDCYAMAGGIVWLLNSIL